MIIYYCKNLDIRPLKQTKKLKFKNVAKLILHMLKCFLQVKSIKWWIIYIQISEAVVHTLVWVYMHCFRCTCRRPWKITKLFIFISYALSSQLISNNYERYEIKFFKRPKFLQGNQNTLWEQILCMLTYFGPHSKITEVQKYSHWLY